MELQKVAVAAVRGCQEPVRRLETLLSQLLWQSLQQVPHRLGLEGETHHVAVGRVAARCTDDGAHVDVEGPQRLYHLWRQLPQRLGLVMPQGSPVALPTLGLAVGAGRQLGQGAVRALHVLWQAGLRDHPAALPTHPPGLFQTPAAEVPGPRRHPGRISPRGGAIQRRDLAPQAFLSAPARLRKRRFLNLAALEAAPPPPQQSWRQPHTKTF